MKYGKPITEEMIRRFRKNYEQDPTARMLTGVVAQNPLDELAYLPSEAVKLRNSFSIDLKSRDVTNQKKSGRCWLFASMNTMRESVAEKCNLEKFEFSNNYGAFWDKFEKINVILENAIETADRDIRDRYVEQVLNGLGDGGYWEYAVNIVKKYGCVPDYVMPETFQSENTAQMRTQISRKLRKDALTLRALVNRGEDPQPVKEAMLEGYFKALCICFGEPVETFNFEYTDKDGVHHADYGLTPQGFYEKYVGCDLDDYLMVLNATTDGHPYNKVYTVKMVSNMIESRLFALNVELDRLKEMVVAQMKDGQITWFGCDCSKSGDRAKGIWDTACFDYGSLLGGLDLSMTKAEKQVTTEATMNHAMAFTGVNFNDKNEIDRWKIQNSWGSENGQKGYYVASADWFDEYVYGAVIHKKYFNPTELAALNEEPIELEPWDPVSY